MSKVLANVSLEELPRHFVFISRAMERTGDWGMWTPCL